jgi:hypothetical protein
VHKKHLRGNWFHFQIQSFRKEPPFPFKVAFRSNPATGKYNNFKTPESTGVRNSIAYSAASDKLATLDSDNMLSKNFPTPNYNIDDCGGFTCFKKNSVLNENIQTLMISTN